MFMVNSINPTVSRSSITGALAEIASDFDGDMTARVSVGVLLYEVMSSLAMTDAEMRFVFGDQYENIMEYIGE